MQEILAIGFFQGLILSSLLFLKSRQNKNFTWLMGLFVLLISAFIAGPLLNQWIGEPWGSFLVDPLFLLIGPSFYGYILLLSRPEKEKSLKFHTIPFFLYLPLLAFFASKVYKTQADPQSLKLIYSSGFAVGLGIIKFAHLLIYVGLSFWELRNHQDRIQKIFSNLKGKDLLWVKYILISFLALSLISLGFYLFALQNPNWQNEITFFNLVLLSVFLISLTFYSFHQKSIFDFRFKSKEIQFSFASEKENPKYEKSGLKEHEVTKINQKIDQWIQNKGYLDPEVNLGVMADAIGVSPYRISEVLGKYRKTSFYDLINSHRIREIQQALSDPNYAHLSILGIAFEFGFNAKSTFNTAFKKFTGMSPSEFKRSNN
ncbi:helix-turn-helix domain-containing protein [Algoriphagus limi]|uniref:Helix-turn-helix domain-containing protein n=1 Tax=Algoriphagus limi TaxID=2975273 RepID=A0ABT2G4J7_9BACT|nr:helix-turn-helix domain-containing protein [Algoriphagus limi]MCS5490185.1 helix-turn-helix domain-containing protein [Algoriphagus limi]